MKIKGQTRNGAAGSTRVRQSEHDAV